MICMSHRRVRLLLAVIASAGPIGAQAASTASAEGYPARPIRMIVPYAPGGSTDAVVRVLAPKLNEILGQQVVVDNRPGGSSTIGLGIAANAPPDGYTLGVANIAYGANPSLFRKMPFDSEKDLVPVSMLSIVTLVLAVNPSVPARSVKELIAVAKAKPGSLNYASAGNASGNHLATERFAFATGIKMVHVAYKGGGPAIASLVSGETSVLFATIPSSIQHFKTGRLFALGVGDRKRSPALPDVPTIAEAGVPGFEAFEWNGVLVAAGTPQPVIGKLHQALAKALSMPEVKERLVSLGIDPVGSSPEELGAFIKAEFKTWAKVIKAVGITVN